MISLSAVLVGALLVLVQVLAAVPWMLVAFFPRQALLALREKKLFVLQVVGGILLAAVALPAVYFFMVSARDNLEISGRLYAAVLQLQLTVDFFILLFVALLAVWPKGGAVALAAFR